MDGYDIVTSMNWRARSSCYREAYVNYDERVDQPLDRSSSPGDVDAWFYSQVPISRTGAPDDQLKNYNKQEKKKISEGNLLMVYAPVSDADLSVITDDMPQQMCAKRCAMNSCSGFTYDKSYSRGTCYIYRGGLKTNDCESCNTYLLRGSEPIPDRNPAPAPAPAPAPQPLAEVTVYQGENFNRGSTAYKFFESDFRNAPFGMKVATVNWPSRQEVNSAVFKANAHSNWVLGFPSREKNFAMPGFSGTKEYNTMDGAGGYHGSMMVFRK